MTLEEAEKHLEDIIEPNGNLDSLGWYLLFRKGKSTATLYGDFTAEDLEAISVYMKHNGA